MGEKGGRSEDRETSMIVNKERKKKRKRVNGR